MNEADVIQEIRENIIEMKGMLENISMRSDLKMETFEEKLKVVNNRISDLESNQKWFVCAICHETYPMEATKLQNGQLRYCAHCANIMKSLE